MAVVASASMAQPPSDMNFGSSLARGFLPPLSGITTSASSSLTSPEAAATSMQAPNLPKLMLQAPRLMTLVQLAPSPSSPPLPTQQLQPTLFHHSSPPSPPVAPAATTSSACPPSSTATSQGSPPASISSTLPQPPTSPWTQVLSRCAALASVASVAAQSGAVEHVQAVMLHAAELQQTIAAFTRTVSIAAPTHAPPSPHQHTPPTSPPTQPSQQMPVRTFVNMSGIAPSQRSQLFEFATVAESVADDVASVLGPVVKRRRRASSSVSSAERRRLSQDLLKPSTSPPPSSIQTTAPSNAPPPIVTTSNGAVAPSASSPTESAVQRRCRTCQATDTPEWRKGPDGLNTLCNACGLQYAKSQRKRSISLLLN